MRQPRHDVAVAAIVAAAADRRQGAGFRPALPQGGEGRCAGPLHQVDAGHAEFVDGSLVDGAHVGGGVKILGQLGVAHG